LVVGGGNGNACHPAWSWIMSGMAWIAWIIACLSAAGMLCCTFKWLFASLATHANWQLLQINKWLHLGAGIISWFYALNGLGCNVNLGF
jgi:hypothetical protein